ncbi:MAG: hypothetical protein EBZ77_12905, partial [Chitinophagia bacterium]|nr:hypothetical protein [Chitinophagia bacterium]
ISDFAYTVRASGAKYAIPFASNHCHLHKDTFEFNHYIQDPALVRKYFADHKIESPQLKVMLSGDSWSKDGGFVISDKDWFTNKEQILLQYRDDNADKLDAFYKQEEATRLPLKVMQNYFKKLADVTPKILKSKFFKGHKFTYVLRVTDDKKLIFDVDMMTGDVVELDSYSDEKNPIQIHTTAFIMLRCIAFNIFSHMSIGKRVFYRVRSDKKRNMEMLNSVFNLYEYDMLPLKNIRSKRSLETWRLRYRELFLYASLAKDKVLTGKMDLKKYLKPYAA